MLDEGYNALIKFVYYVGIACASYPSLEACHIISKT